MAENRKPLDATTEITIAWIQQEGKTIPTAKQVTEFFLEVYKTILKRPTT